MQDQNQKQQQHFYNAPHHTQHVQSNSRSSITFAPQELNQSHHNHQVDQPGPQILSSTQKDMYQKNEIQHHFQGLANPSNDKQVNASQMHIHQHPNGKFQQPPQFSDQMAPLSYQSIEQSHPAHFQMQYESRQYTQIRQYGNCGQGFMQSNFVQTMQPGPNPNTMNEPEMRRSPYYNGHHMHLKHHQRSEAFMRPDQVEQMAPVSYHERQPVAISSSQPTQLNAGQPTHAQFIAGPNSNRFKQYDQQNMRVPEQMPGQQFAGQVISHSQMQMRNTRFDRVKDDRQQNNAVPQDQQSYIQTKKRSYMTMMEQQHFGQDANDHIMSQQQPQNDPHSHFGQINSLDERMTNNYGVTELGKHQQEEEASRTESLAEDDDQFEKNALLDNAPQVRSGQPEENDHSFNEKSANIDHPTRNLKQIDHTRQKQQIMQTNFSKSPSPVNVDDQREFGSLTKSGKKSRSKISPPSRIKDSRSKKESRSKFLPNIKRSQTGIKKMKIEKNTENFRKSHSSEAEQVSNLSDNSQRQRKQQKSFSDESSNLNNSLQSTPQRKKNVSYLANSKSKIDATATPKKKGGTKQFGSITGGSSIKKNNPKVDQTQKMTADSKRKNAVNVQFENKIEIPIQLSKLKDQQEIKEKVDFSNNNNHLSHDRQKNKVTQNHYLNRPSGIKGKKSNGKQNIGPSSSRTRDKQQENLSVSSDEQQTKHVAGKSSLHRTQYDASKTLKRSTTKIQAEVSDNSVRFDSYQQRQSNAKIRPPAPLRKTGLNDQIIHDEIDGSRRQQSKIQNLTPQKIKGQSRGNMPQQDKYLSSKSNSPASKNYQSGHKKRNNGSASKLKNKKNLDDSCSLNSSGDNEANLRDRRQNVRSSHQILKKSRNQKNVKDAYLNNDHEDDDELDIDHDRDDDESDKVDDSLPGDRNYKKSSTNQPSYGQGRSQNLVSGREQDNDQDQSLSMNYFIKNDKQGMQVNSRARTTRQANKGTPSPSSTQNQQQNAKETSSGIGQGSTRGRSANAKKASNQPHHRSKQRVNVNLKQQDKSKKSQILKKSEKEIQKILKMYFEYICSELITSRKIAEIQLGKVISKMTFEDQKTIEMKVTNICFNQYTQKQDREMRELSSQRSSSLRKVSPLTRIASNKSNIRKQTTEQPKSYGKDFRIGDIIDLTQQKQKDKANLYLIYEILVSLDFNGKNKTEKVDDELPDVDIKFKVHPIIQSYTIKAFPEAQRAQKYINDHIDDEYILDKNSIVCLFEIGHRDIEDKRLEFENFVMNFQQVQKSYQMKTGKECEQFTSKLRMCRHQNTLANSTNYEKAYLIEYGYKFESPTKIFTMTPLHPPMGSQPDQQKQNLGSGQKNRSNSKGTNKRAFKQSEDELKKQWQLNIKPYQKKKQKEKEKDNSTPSKKSANKSVSSQIKHDQRQYESDSNLEQGPKHQKNALKKQKSPAQRKRGAQKYQKSTGLEERNQNEMSQSMKRDGIRTRGQVVEDSSNSPIPKNISLSSQNVRKRRLQGKEDSDNHKQQQNQNLDYKVDQLITANRSKQPAIRGIGGRSGGRRIAKNEKNKSRRYHQTQSNSPKNNIIEKTNKNVEQNTERDQSLTVSEDSHAAPNKNIKALKKNIEGKNEQEEEPLDLQVPLPQKDSIYSEKESSENENSTDNRRSRRRLNAQKVKNKKQETVSQQQSSVHDSQSQSNVKKRVENLDNQYTDKRLRNKTKKLNEDLYGSNKKQSTVIAINKNLESHHNNETLSQKSMSSSDVGVSRSKRRRHQINEVKVAPRNLIDEQVKIRPRTIKEDENESNSDVSMKSKEDRSSPEPSRSLTRSNRVLQTQQLDNSSNFSLDELSTKKVVEKGKGLKSQYGQTKAQNASQKSLKKKEVINSQITTRRRQGRMQRASSSSDADEKDGSAIDYEMDQDEDDDVSQILMPNGDQKQEKNRYANEYDEACSKLQLNSIPSQLPCRDQEQQRITDFVLNGLSSNGSSNSLYISGMPGTGKTATTLEVIRKLLRSQQGRGGSKKFEFIHINAMSLSNPNLVYTILAEKIIGRRMNPHTAALFLDEYFKKKDKREIVQRHMLKSKSQNSKKANQMAQKVADRTRVLLVDELDALITQKQTLLYNLFEWPCNINSRLLVICIANTMNLPERLQTKIQSRIGQNRLVYEPYTKEQILTILKSRLEGISVFDNKSIDIVSRKVAQYSGDMRRSLQITKRAVELCREKFMKENQNGQKRNTNERMNRQAQSQCSKKQLINVSVDHVVAAFDEQSKSSLVEVMKGLRKFEVLVLIALFLEQKEEKISLDLIQDRSDTIIQSMANYEQSKKMAAKNSTFKNGTPLLENLDNEFEAHEDRKSIEYANWAYSRMTTSMFREIVKRLQAYGLINLQIEANKLTDYAFVSHFNFFDFVDLRNAFYNNEIYKVQQKFILMNSKK